MGIYLDKNLVLEETRSLNDSKFAILGFPFDSTCSYRAGTKEGPYQIRREFLELDKPESFWSNSGFFDAGNLVCAPCNLIETMRRQELELTQILEENKNIIPITLGGEHSASYIPIKLLAGVHKDLQVAHFDAHPDLMDEYLGEKWSHTTVMRRVFEDATASIVQFGVRTGTDEEKAQAKLLPKKLDSKKPTYISIDMDVIEPGHCPGVGTPEPGGIIIQELTRELKKIKNIVGFDIVETSPPYDKGNITSVTAARTLITLMEQLS